MPVNNRCRKPALNQSSTSLAPASLGEFLRDKELDAFLEAFEFEGINPFGFGFVEGLLGAGLGGFDGRQINFCYVDRGLGEHGNRVAQHFGEAVVHGDVFRFTSFENLEFPGLDFGHQRHVPGKNTDLARLCGQYDLIGLGGEDFFVRSDDFESQGHQVGRWEGGEVGRWEGLKVNFKCSTILLAARPLGYISEFSVWR